MGEVPKQLKPYLFKAGNRLGGRKKGKTLKEFARAYLASLPEKERIAFLNSVDPDLVWRMAEGNPDQKNENHGNVFVEISESIAKKRDITSGANENS